MNILLAVILGGLFGFALYFAGASHPKKLVSMLKLQDISLMKIILFAIGPVSYTHLDVYKRQSQYASGIWEAVWVCVCRQG